jgi:hypothetical protein
MITKAGIMKIHLFLTLFFLILLTSCGKKIEKQFPLGYYRLTIDSDYVFEGVSYERNGTLDRFKLIERNKEELIFQHFFLYEYALEDTLFSALSPLQIIDKTNIVGTIFFDASNSYYPDEEEKYDLKNSKIIEYENGVFGIEGEIEFPSHHSIDPVNYKVRAYGTYSLTPIE